MQNYCITTDPNQYQRMFNLAGDMFAGYMCPTNTWTYSNTYNFYDEWYNVAFDVAYGKVMAAWRVMDLAKDDDPVTFAFAQILKIYGMHKVTDMYGPIPYSQFGKAEKVPYDSQETVYNSFLTELTDAIAVLTDYVQTYPDARPLKKYDAIYAGDYSKWVKFANTLQLRLATRISYADPAKAKQYAEAAAKHPLGLLDNNADNAYYPVPQRNPLNEIWDAYADTRMGATLACYMNGYSDPRRPFYFTQQSYQSNPGYYGVRLGASINSSRRNTANNACALPNVASNTPMQWMVAAESWFLRAEGALRGWDMGATAGDLYNEGIQTSLEQAGVGASAAAYIADNTSVPENYVCVWRSNENYPYNPANTLTIQWDDAASDDVKLEKIITQKYLALFPDGQEAWSEFRRTGSPKVIPVPTNRNQSGGKVDTDIQVRRLPFPSTEYANNADEVKKAVDLLGGEDNGGTKLWWDKK